MCHPWTLFLLEKRKLVLTYSYIFLLAYSKSIDRYSSTWPYRFLPIHYLSCFKIILSETHTSRQTEIEIFDPKSAFLPPLPSLSHLQGHSHIYYKRKQEDLANQPELSLKAWISYIGATQSLISNKTKYSTDLKTNIRSRKQLHTLHTNCGRTRWVKAVPLFQRPVCWPLPVMYGIFLLLSLKIVNNIHTTCFHTGHVLLQVFLRTNWAW